MFAFLEKKRLVKDVAEERRLAKAKAAAEARVSAENGPTAIYANKKAGSANAKTVQGQDSPVPLSPNESPYIRPRHHGSLRRESPLHTGSGSALRDLVQKHSPASARMKSGGSSPLQRKNSDPSTGDVKQTTRSTARRISVNRGRDGGQSDQIRQRSYSRSPRDDTLEDWGESGVFGSKTAASRHRDLLREHGISEITDVGHSAAVDANASAADTLGETVSPPSASPSVGNVDSHESDVNDKIRGHVRNWHSNNSSLEARRMSSGGSIDESSNKRSSVSRSSVSVPSPSSKKSPARGVSEDRLGSLYSKVQDDVGHSGMDWGEEGEERPEVVERSRRSAAAERVKVLESMAELLSGKVIKPMKDHAELRLKELAQKARARTGESHGHAGDETLANTTQSEPEGVPANGRGETPVANNMNNDNNNNNNSSNTESLSNKTSSTTPAANIKIQKNLSVSRAPAEESVNIEPTPAAASVVATVEISDTVLSDDINGRTSISYSTQPGPDLPLISPARIPGIGFVTGDDYSVTNSATNNDSATTDDPTQRKKKSPKKKTIHRSKKRRSSDDSGTTSGSKRRSPKKKSTSRLKKKTTSRRGSSDSSVGRRTRSRSPKRKIVTKKSPSKTGAKKSPTRAARPKRKGGTTLRKKSKSKGKSRGKSTESDSPGDAEPGGDANDGTIVHGSPHPASAASSLPEPLSEDDARSKSLPLQKPGLFGKGAKASFSKASLASTQSEELESINPTTKGISTPSKEYQSVNNPLNPKFQKSKLLLLGISLAAASSFCIQTTAITAARQTGFKYDTEIAVLLSETIKLVFSMVATGWTLACMVLEDEMIRRMGKMGGLTVFGPRLGRRTISSHHHHHLMRKTVTPDLPKLDLSPVDRARLGGIHVDRKSKMFYGEGEHRASGGHSFGHSQRSAIPTRERGSDEATSTVTPEKAENHQGGSKVEKRESVSNTATDNGNAAAVRFAGGIAKVVSLSAVTSAIQATVLFKAHEGLEDKQLQHALQPHHAKFKDDQYLQHLFRASDQRSTREALRYLVWGFSVKTDVETDGDGNVESVEPEASPKMKSEIPEKKPVMIIERVPGSIWTTSFWRNALSLLWNASEIFSRNESDHFGKMNLLTMVPAICYLLQNNLTFLCLSNYLNGPYYQLLCTFKIVTTGLLFRLVLCKKQTLLQIMAIGLLALALATCCLDQIHGSASSGKLDMDSDFLKGSFFVLIICLCSSLAGVACEFSVKRAKLQHVANLKTYFSGVVLSLCYMKHTRGEKAWEDILAFLQTYCSPTAFSQHFSAGAVKAAYSSGLSFAVSASPLIADDSMTAMFQNHLQALLVNLNPNGLILCFHTFVEVMQTQFALMWVILLVQAFLGVMISFLFKYADIMMKIYAVSGSVLFTTLISWWFWNFEITISFVVGYALYLISSLLYYLSPEVLLKQW